MRRSDWPPLILLGGSFFGTLAIVVELVRQGHLPSTVIDSGLLPAITVFLSVTAAYLGYVSARTSQRLVMSESRRDEFLRSELLNRIRMLVENNDIELQTVVIILNITHPHEYDSDTLPIAYWRLHEEFDLYLDFLEGVAILYINGDMFQDSAEGLWRYYAARLMEVSTLHADTDTIKLRQIRECMEGIYGGKIPRRIEAAWQKALRGNIERGRMVHDPLTHEPINPLENPIWFYINSGAYTFEPLIRMILKLESHGALVTLKSHIARRWKRLLQ